MRFAPLSRAAAVALLCIACDKADSPGAAPAEAPPAVAPDVQPAAEPKAAPAKPPPAGDGPYGALCKKACAAKKGCGMLNPTTLEECEFGCVQTLGVTLSCKPTGADIERCVKETEAAECVTIATIGGPVPCKLCP